MIGSNLGDRYQVEARLGSGGMAEVFRGTDQVLNRTVAIKILLPQFARDASFVDRFRREAQAAARLNHPNIVAVYDHGADDSTQWIVMEFIEGRTLADFLASGRRPSPMQSVEIARTLCDALASAHAQGVIHRDIKPGNVMVTRDGTIKLMDLGIARLVSGKETAPQTSAVLGTAAYMSPEQAQGQSVDARTDIYSLGVVLYEMLTGRAPFVGDSPMAVAYKQVNETPATPSSLNPDVPPPLNAVVMRALSKNPSNRYQTAVEFEDDLDRVHSGREVRATPLLPAEAGPGATQVISRPQPTAVLPPRQEPPGSSRKVWLGVLIGILVVAVLGGGVYLLATSLLGDNTADTKTVVLPNVVGERYGQAKRELTGPDLGLRVVREDRFVDDGAEVGIVQAMDPKAQTEVASGSEVTLTVGKARALVEVPDLTGRTLDDANTILSDAGLVLGSHSATAPSDTVPVDQIVDQSPDPLVQVSKGTSVNVVLSSGPATATVPDVTCRSFGAAKSELSHAGFAYVVGDPVPVNPLCPNQNRVAAQDPLGGTEAQAGSTVTIYPSGGTSTSPSPGDQ